MQGFHWSNPVCYCCQWLNSMYFTASHWLIPGQWKDKLILLLSACHFRRVLWFSNDWNGSMQRSRGMIMISHRSWLVYSKKHGTWDKYQSSFHSKGSRIRQNRREKNNKMQFLGCLFSMFFWFTVINFQVCFLWGISLWRCQKIKSVSLG